jgi:Spy/CpxP family protein refolding chaperone
MIRSHLTTLIPALALSALAMTSLSAAAAPDDQTPPPSSAPGTEAPPNGHHHNAAWQACKKQADDQNVAAGDARREFMKSCMKSAKAPPAPSS